MKTLKLSISSCAMAAMFLMISMFTGCGLFGSGNSDADTGSTDTGSTVYTIQYTDDNGTHIIEVEDGATYSLETIPTREGYDFLGLFDAEVGGTQYVSSNGASLSAFTDKKNIVLFPQYSAKQYTVVLDYGGASVTGDRQLTVSYGESLPELPKNLTLAHSVFSGWYTAEDCGGIQVSDSYGLIPVVSVINSTNFDLSSGYIYLYAGFSIEQFTVTLNYGNGIPSETIQVDYNTSVSEIVTNTRDEDGRAVLLWSKTQDGSQYFTGEITDNTVLYAAEWAPVIELDANGGEDISPVVARAGTSVTLPTPTRANYRFMGWQYSDGTIAEISVMPSASVSLTASWQAMLVFDENGGTDVEDISQSTGTSITLPTPTKEGYVFAGWYTSDKTQYNSTTMPAASVELKAGWYEEKTDTVVVISSTSSSSAYSRTSPSTSILCYTFNFADYITTGETVNITIVGNVNIRTTSTGTLTAYLDFYSQKTISSLYLMKTLSFSNITSTYRNVTFTETFTVSDSFYMCWYISSSGSYMYLQDFYYTVYYPDTTTLYL